MTNWWRVDQMLGHFCLWLGKDNNGVTLVVLLTGISLGIGWGSGGSCYD